MNEMNGRMGGFMAENFSQQASRAVDKPSG